MKSTTKLGALTMAALLVLTALAPAAVAAQESGNVSVTTDAATGVGEESATLNGNVTELDGNATVYFTYWVEGDQANATTTPELEATSTGDFSIQVDDLEENTTYVYAAHAETDNDSAVGTTETLTTDEETELEVETGDATDVTNSSATLNGELEELDGIENATVQFTYWAAGDEANNTTTVSQTLDDAGDFSAAVDGLANNTTYYYQASADGGDLSAEGDVESFTTGVEDDDESVSVTTDGASDVTNSSATLTAEVDGLDANETANVSFTYWVEGDADNSTTVEAGNLSEDGTFSTEVTGLENNTTYVYYATADVNSSYSSDESSFTTGVEDEEGDGDGFGQQVSAFVHDLLSDDDREGGIGQAVSDFVTENNPGADKRPDHAGKPDHAGPKDKVDKQGGPKDDKGPDWKNDDEEEEDGNTTSTSGDDDYPGNGNGHGKDK